jgi:hypothetical protein
MKRNDFGVSQMTVPAKHGKCAIQHNSKIKVTFQLQTGKEFREFLLGLQESRKTWEYRQYVMLNSLRIYDAHGNDEIVPYVWFNY